VSTRRKNRPTGGPGGSGGDSSFGDGGTSPDGDRLYDTVVVDPEAEKVPPPGQPPVGGSQAMVVSRRRSLLASEQRALVPATGLSGMATAEQLDAFRQLRTSLQSMASAVGLRDFTTLVVPVTAGSGASFVARNLAAAFTLQEGRDAVLVDCNMRNPTQHVALGVSSEGGLFDYLEQPEWSFERLVRRTPVPGLHLIPAGRPRSVPREYFSSQRMRVLMNALREEVCDVILDGPPTIGSPDARILSDLADFVVLVTGYGRDTHEQIAHASALFEPGKFAGVVFNERPAAKGKRSGTDA
jgi:Mrp family chromosome partitioning ATPase